jgi:type III pantothenate kinase
MIAERDDHSCDHPHEHEHTAGKHEAAQHLILASIGNTRLSIALWTDEKRAAAQAFAVDAANEAVAQIDQMWKSLPVGDKRAVVITSVNPPVLQNIRQACNERHIDPVLVVGNELEPPMPADVNEPEKVGTDRLCAAAAAFAKIKGACVVADFGTAVTIDLVADNGVFLGGTILPGMALSARALHEYTAQLPLVEIGRPTEVLGKDTASAIRNGIFAMMAGALREITERYAADIGKWPPLVVTGGDAEAIAGACDFVDRIAPDLVLDGLVIAWRNTFETQETE